MPLTRLVIAGLVVVCVLLVALALLDASRPARVSRPAAAPTERDERDAAALAHSALEHDASSRAVDAEARVELSAIPEGAPFARLCGRVIDLRGDPIAGAVVTAYGNFDALGNLQTRNPAPRARYGSIEHSTRSASDGRYALEVPLDEMFEATVDVSARYFGRHRVSFGFRETHDQPPFSAGETVWPDFVLADAGDVSGRLVDASGRPVADVEVTVWMGGEVEAFTKSAADGTFLAQDVACGAGALGTFKLGYERIRFGDLRVRARETNELGDVLLPFLRGVGGRVEDELGKPIESVELRAVPLGGGASATASSNYKGEFFLELDDERESQLSAKQRGQQVAEPDSWRVSAATRDLRITLRRQADSIEFVEFQVVDAATGEPITPTRIALDDEPVFWSSFDGFYDPRYIHGENGRRTVRLYRAVNWVYCESPEHAPLETRLVVSPGEGAVQVLRLDRGARIRGQLVDGAHAPLRLVRQSTDGNGQPSAEVNLTAIGVDHLHGGLSAYTGRPRYLRCDAQGEFVFEGLSGGTYQLLLHHPVRGALRRFSLSVATGGTLDLGRVE